MSDPLDKYRGMTLDQFELDRAEGVEKRILAKQTGDRKGCAFCGSMKVEAIIRPIIAGEVQQPAMTTHPLIGAGYPVTLMQCFNCSHIMMFLEDENIFPEGR